MRSFVIGALLLLLFISFWPAESATSTQEIGEAWTGLITALINLLRWYAILDHAVHERLWELLSGELLPLLGALRCLNLLLTLLGLYVLALWDRFTRGVF